MTSTTLSTSSHSVTDDGALRPSNLIGGAWQDGRGAELRTLRNPADRDELVAQLVGVDGAQVDQAVDAAAEAQRAWASTPLLDRVALLFRFKGLLEAHADELAELIVRENGKLLAEARGDVRRGIDVVDFACGLPSQLQGYALSDISSNVDCQVHREALGVMAGVPPCNFPAMIPLWLMPVAVGCGNAFILKPAEKAPLTGTRIVELFAEAGLPAGVISVLQGGRDTVERLIAHERLSAISFVGSTAVAQSIYREAAARGKRVQALGGAKNHLIVLPDADLARTVPALIGSCFGCAGQRCLAGSVLVAVGDAERRAAVRDAVVAAAGALRLGDGMDAKAGMGPLIDDEQRDRVLSWIDVGLSEGAELLLDGRTARADNRPRGSFLGASVFGSVRSDMRIAQEEIFGPVLSLLECETLDQAIDISNATRFGNSASLFTGDGAAARRFRERIQCGMLGINLGVPAPMAMFSFGGWKQSLFGDSHAYGADAVHFATRKQVVTERWFGAEAPKDGWV